MVATGMSTKYRSHLTADEHRAAIAALRLGRIRLDREIQLAREEQASREVCDRRLQEREPQELVYAI